MPQDTPERQLSVVNSGPAPDVGDDLVLDLFHTDSIFTAWVADSVTWGALAASFAEPTVVRRPGGIRGPDGNGLSEAERAAVKGAAGGYVLGRFEGARRRRTELADRCALSIDIDQPVATGAGPLGRGDALATPALLQLVGQALRGTAWLAHSTFSHRTEFAKLRVIVPLSRRVDEAEFAYLTRVVGARIGIELLDTTCAEAARLMYPPVLLADEAGAVSAEYVARRGRGLALDVERTLARGPAGEDWRNRSEAWPKSAAERRSGNAIGRARDVRGAPADRPGIPGALCAVVTVNEALARCPERWSPPVHGDEAADSRRWSHTSGTGAPGGEATDSIGLFYSHHADTAFSQTPMDAFEVLVHFATIAPVTASGAVAAGLDPGYVPPDGWPDDVGFDHGEGGVHRARGWLARLVGRHGMAPSADPGTSVTAERIEAVTEWVASWPAVAAEMDRRAAVLAEHFPAAGAWPVGVEEGGALGEADSRAWLAPGRQPVMPERRDEARPRTEPTAYQESTPPGQVIDEDDWGDVLDVGVGAETAGVAVRADFLEAEERQSRQHAFAEARRALDARAAADKMPWDAYEAALEALQARFAGEGTPREEFERRAAQAPSAGARGSGPRQDYFGEDRSAWAVGTGMETGGSNALRYTGLLQRDKTGAVTSAASNTYAAVVGFPELARSVRLDTRTGDVVFVSDVPGDAAGPGVKVAGNGFGARMTEGLLVRLAGLLGRRHLTPVEGGGVRGPSFTSLRLREELTSIAEQYPFDPVALYLESRVWDGVPRLHRVFPEILKVADNEYHRQLGTLLFRAGVRRALRPGCQYDHVIVLSGGEGIRKSTFCAQLAPDPAWFSDQTPPIGGVNGSREIIESLSGKWIIELAELTSTRRSEAEAVKHFITTRVDRGRPAYARDVVDLPRQVVMLGTTNETDYLKGFGTDRRFLPVDLTGVSSIDTELLVRWRPQLWAEAVALEAKDQRPLVLTGEAVPQGVAARDDVREDFSELEERLVRFLESPEQPGDLEPGGEWSAVGEGFAGAGGPPRQRVCENQLLDKVGTRTPRFGVGKAVMAGERGFVRAYMDRRAEGWTRLSERPRFAGYGRARHAWIRDAGNSE